MKEEKGVNKMNVLAIVGIVVVMGVSAQIFMKRGMNEVGEVSLKEMISPKIFNVFLNKFVFVGVALYGLSSVLYLVAISMEDVSFVYPLIGSAYILTTVFAWIFFREKVTTMKIIGILLISVGAYFVVMKW
ncbi:MAG: EamA family transporter [Candidatus Aenigmarchaeota archaeon]|nr:EamA family transporter [Candidatus Aenigmarchaeota archaeon]